MAISNSNSKSIYAPASSSYPYTLATSFTETSTSTSNNTSTISCSASLSASNIAFSVSGGGTLAVYWHDNYTNSDTLVSSITVSKCGSGSYGTKSTSGSITATHKSDGTLSGYSKAVWTKNKSNSYIPASGNVSTSNTTLTSIPRQATVNSATNFNDEGDPTITYTNSAGNSVTTLQACIASSDGGTIYADYRDISKTGSSYTFDLTDTERNTLRNATPNSKTLSVRFYVKTIINGTTYYSYKSATLTIVNANPSIDTIGYSDTNSTTTNITNDDQIIIQNQSTLQFQMYDVVSLKGATLSNLAININGNVTNVSLSGTSIVSTTYDYGVVDVSEDTNATLTLTDSRDNTATYSVPITIWEYSNPSAIISVSREANYYSQSSINVDANYSSLDGNNTITIEYRTKKTSDDTWGAWASLNDNEETSFTADNQYAWDIQVQIYDIFETTNYTINNALDIGIPLVYYDLKNRSVGVNCIPSNTSTLEVDGDIYLNGLSLSSNSIYDESLNASSGYIRYTNGFMIQWKATTTTGGGTAWNSPIYYSDVTMGDWDIAFTTIFNCIPSVASTLYWCTNANFSTTSAGELRVFRPNAATASIYVRVFAYGLWE